MVGTGMIGVLTLFLTTMQNDAIEACLTYQRAIIDQAAAMLDKAAEEIRREARTIARWRSVIQLNVLAL